MGDYYVEGFQIIITRDKGSPGTGQNYFEGKLRTGLKKYSSLG
jgi:hypothetical protein